MEGGMQLGTIHQDVYATMNGLIICKNAWRTRNGGVGQIRTNKSAEELREKNWKAIAQGEVEKKPKIYQICKSNIKKYIHFFS